MPFRIAWLRNNPQPGYEKAWVKSVRRDGTFRYTSSPNIAKVWMHPTAPQRALDKRVKSTAHLLPEHLQKNLIVERFNADNPGEVNPVIVPFEELEEHGLI